MQFKTKIILVILVLAIIGIAVFFLLRKKSAPVEDPLDDPPVLTPAEVPSDEQEQPTPTTTPAKPLVPVKLSAPNITPVPTTVPTAEPDEPDQPTPTTTPARPLVPVRQEASPESSMIIGKRGKFQSEGGVDVNNKTDILSFPPARSVDLHIEHVDVHRGDPQNKNAYIIFKYKNESHKFTFVGNGGLRFKKKDGTFGPNLGVGDASSIVLRDLGLPIDSYKIECLTTTGRNTWHFKPLDLSKELIGVQMTDNADWGGLRGVYFKAIS